MKPYNHCIAVLTLLGLLVIPDRGIWAQSHNWQWAKSFGGTLEEAGVTMAIDPVTGDVYTTGHFKGTVDFDPGDGVFLLSTTGWTDVFVSKVDREGNFVWARSMGGSAGCGGQAIALETSPSGGIWITGWFYETVDFDPGPDTYALSSAGLADIFMCKLDRSGNFIWAKSVGGPGYDFCNALVIDPGTGDVYSTGNFEETVDFDPSSNVYYMTSEGLFDIFIAKWTETGGFVWASRIGQFDYDYVYSIALDAQGNVYTTGHFNGPVDFDPGSEEHYLLPTGEWDIYVLKLDSGGRFRWAKAVGGTGYDQANAIAVDRADGGLYVTGYFEGTADFDPGAGVLELTSAGHKDAFLLKLSDAGDLVWAKSFGGSLGDNSFSVAVSQMEDRNVYVAGFFKDTADLDPGPGIAEMTSAGAGDIFISAFEASGEFAWARSAGGENGEQGSCLATDPLGNVYVMGIFSSPEIMFDSILVIHGDPSWMFDPVFIAKLGNRTTSTQAMEQPSGVLIYPNPAGSFLNIETSTDGTAEGRISIFNASGSRVIDISLPTRCSQIDISRLAAGLYFLKQTCGTAVKTGKFVKT